MKKVLSLVILISMTLHCLSRLEVISYVYGHRHDIALAVGINTEKVIAMCKSDYFQGNALATPQETDHRDASAPVMAQEINLATPPAILQSSLIPGVVVTYEFPSQVPVPSHLIISDIFHPPLV